MLNYINNAPTFDIFIVINTLNNIIFKLILFDFYLPF